MQMTPCEAKLTRQLEEAMALIKTLQAALAQERQENRLLRQKIHLLVRQRFGKSSEQLPVNQLELALALGEVEVIVPAPAPPPPLKAAEEPKPRRARVPEHLPVVEEVLEPAAVQAQPEQWRRIGQEVSEQLDYEPGRLFRRRLVRPRYVRKDNKEAAPVIAPLPERLQERGLPAPGLLAHVLVAKYCDHLPLYRQENIFARRHGVEISRQTMTRWVEVAAEWLKPVYEQIRTGVMAGGYVQVDETPVEYLDPGRGRTGQGYLWTCARPEGDVVFRWETSRAAECLGRVLPVDFRGTVQCDGYAAYDAFARTRPGELKLAACWAHARRKFHEAKEESPRVAGWLLRQIQHLYRIEAELRAAKAGPGLRQAVRAGQSRMLVERIGRALKRLRTKPLPKSLLGQAIQYALGQWEGLLAYLEDGRLEIDNNTVENAIRPTAIGKKNWLFMGEAGAGQRGAILYTVIESCRRRGLDPYAYLKHVLERLPRMTNHQVASLLPGAWQSSQHRAAA